MKKIFSSIIIIALFSSIFFSCGKENTDIVYEKIHDTVYLNDTIFVRDTIVNVDTLFIIDSIFTTDTIIMIDTIIIHDTSEFGYLFKHYELGVYDLLFYTYDKQKSPYQICAMNSNAHDIRIIDEGIKTYPVWANEDDFIYYVDFENVSIIRKDIGENPVDDSIIISIDRNVQFLRFDKQLQVFLFSYHDGERTRIAAIDYQAAKVIELTDIGQNEANPVCSKVDDWIYYSSLQSDTWDIYRKKLDGSNVEVIFEDTNFNLMTFNVSADGKFLITPKFKDGKGLVVFYDIKRQSIIHELELPVQGHPLYATLSDDNKAIFFVNGTPYDYTKPRNIYRMALDRTQLFQLTHYTDHLAIRPLIK